MAEALATEVTEWLWLRESLGVESWKDATAVPVGRCAKCRCTFANRGMRAKTHFDSCVLGVGGCR